MNYIVLLVLTFLLTITLSSLQQLNIHKMEQILSQDHSWIKTNYFRRYRSGSIVKHEQLDLANFDSFLSSFKYLDQKKSFAVTDMLKQHLIIASLSDSYRTMIFNFKIDQQNGHYDEILLVSKVYDQNNKQYINFTVVQGKINAQPINKYRVYYTRKCKCLWYTICIQQECITTEHHIARNYKDSEIANLKLALRFQTYHIIVKNLYRNRNQLEFIGLAALTNYLDKIKLPARVSAVQQNGSVIDLIADTNNNDNDGTKHQIVNDEEVAGNSDGSVLVDDLNEMVSIFGSKEQLYGLVWKDSNRYLVQQKIVANIATNSSIQRSFAVNVSIQRTLGYSPPLIS